MDHRVGLRPSDDIGNLLFVGDIGHHLGDTRLVDRLFRHAQRHDVVTRAA